MVHLHHLEAMTLTLAGDSLPFSLVAFISGSVLVTTFKGFCSFPFVSFSGDLSHRHVTPCLPPSSSLSSFFPNFVFCAPAASVTHSPVFLTYAFLSFSDSFLNL